MRSHMHLYMFVDIPEECLETLDTGSLPRGQTSHHWQHDQSLLMRESFRVVISIVVCLYI